MRKRAMGRVQNVRVRTAIPFKPHAAQQWPRLWSRRKRPMRLGIIMNFADYITAIITTSPIPSYPSTKFIEQSYNSIRYHLLDIPILILVDDCRIEQSDWRFSKYDPYKAALKGKNWTNTEIIEFSEFTHQAGMVRWAFQNNKIQTPLILWV